MPISGSGDRQYFYPGVHNPVSSYPSVDIRGGGTQTTAPGTGRLYVLSSSGDLYFKDPDGNEIVVAAGGGTGENVFDNVYISSSLLVKGDTVLSGNVVVGGQIYDLNSNLILSSAVGSIIAASSSLDFTNTDKAYHVRAVNSRLILSSSAGSVVYISGNLQASGSHTLTGTLNLFDGIDERSTGAYHLRAVNSGLVLSSSANSAVYISGNLQASGSHTLTGTLNLFDGIDERSVGSYHVRAVNSNLVLSSSAGSTIYISGNLQASGSHILTGSVSINDNLSLTLDGQYNIRNSVSHLILSSTVGSVIALSASEDFVNSDKPYHVRAVNSHLIISSSAGSVIALSSSVDFTNSDKAYHLRSVNDKLILSSSVGSAIYISGNLQASGSHTLTGSLNLFDGIDEQSLGAYHLRAVNQHLILSSTAGSIVTLSASTDYATVDKTYHIRAVNSPLLLSGTNVIISSSMLATATGSGPALLDKQPTASVPTIVPFRGSATGLLTGIGSNANANNPTIEFIGGGVTGWSMATGGSLTSNNSGVALTCRGPLRSDNSHLVLSSSAGSLIAISGAIVFPSEGPNAANLIARNSHLILSSTVGSVVALSASQDFPTSDKPWHVRAVNSHLILSSTVGSVVALSSNLYFPVDAPDQLAHITAVNSHLILSSTLGSVIRASGALGAQDLTTATLPTADVTLSGSIVWDSTRKALKVYGPEGWTVLATGTVG